MIFNIIINVTNLIKLKEAILFFFLVQQSYGNQIYQDYATNQCPDNPAKILSDCGDNVKIKRNTFKNK